MSLPHFPGFETLFSLAGCVVIVLVSKALGKALIQRREDHYKEP